MSEQPKKEPVVIVECLPSPLDLRIPQKVFMSPLNLELESISVHPDRKAEIPQSQYSHEGIDQLEVQMDAFLDPIQFPLSVFDFTGSLKTSPFKFSCQDLSEMIEREEDETESKEKTKQKNKKMKKTYKKEEQSICISLEEGSSLHHLRLKKHHSDYYHNENVNEANSKLTPDPTTTTTDEISSNAGGFGFPGLLGCPATFKKSACRVCKQSRIVFSFGDASLKKKGEKYTCKECIKLLIGEEKYIDFINVGSNWAFNPSKDAFRVKGWSDFSEYSCRPEVAKKDLQMASLNYLLEEKKSSTHRCLTRMMNCISQYKNKADFETHVLTLKFMNEAVEQIIKVSEIMKQPSVEKMLGLLDAEEKSYYLAEAQKFSQTTAPKIDSQQQNQPQSSALTTKQSIFSFNLGYYSEREDRCTLGKRDMFQKYRSIYMEPEEADYNNLFEPRTSQYLMHSF